MDVRYNRLSYLMNFKFIRNITIIVIVLVLGFYGFINGNNTKTSKITNMNNFKMPTTEEIITKLCSNEFSGRVINSKGNELTVEYIDCVGAKKASPIALKNINRVKDSSQLYDSIKDIFKKHNIHYEDIYSSKKVEDCFEKNFFGVSDYKYFEKNNIPNIHIAQSKISDLILKVEDTPEILDYNLIDALALSLSDYIKNNELKFTN
ncbi:hypothetical protein [Clostridium tetani]|uniref:hypothetical protein n=2 Tax=Clostridium tetani TaxID=1513 RepID=UPI000514355F|nr:hypothetical protein [Clostridium tetani]KGI36890.1 hypothetical protein LA33_12265 [Clostridium tetani ATCC 9441]